MTSDRSATSQFVPADRDFGFRSWHGADRPAIFQTATESVRRLVQSLNELLIPLGRCGVFSDVVLHSFESGVDRASVRVEFLTDDPGALNLVFQH